MADLFLLTMWGDKALWKSFNLDMSVCALESTMRCNYFWITYVESQLASCSSERAAAADNLSSTGRCSRLAEDAVMLMRERSEIHGPLLHVLESERETTDFATTTALCTLSSLAVAESALQACKPFLGASVETTVILTQMERSSTHMPRS